MTYIYTDIYYNTLNCRQSYSIFITYQGIQRHIAHKKGATTRRTFFYSPLKSSFRCLERAFRSTECPFHCTECPFRTTERRFHHVVIRRHGTLAVPSIYSKVQSEQLP